MIQYQPENGRDYRTWYSNALLSCPAFPPFPSLSFTNNISLVVWSVRGQDCSCRFICHLCRNVSIAFADVRASLGEIDTNVPAQMADEPARAVLLHTTKEIIIVCKTKRWRRWARLTASRWLTLRGWNLLWSMSSHRQTNSTVKRQRYLHNQALRFVTQLKIRPVSYIFIPYHEIY